MKNITMTTFVATCKKMTLTGIAALTLAGFSTPSQAGFMDNLMGNLLGVNSPERRLEMYVQVTDKTLVNAFYEISPDGKTETIPDDLKKAGFEFKGVNGAMITFRKRLSESANMQGAANSLNRYQSNADTDEIAQKYIATATARGNTVKLYQPKLSELLAEGFRVFGLEGGNGRQTFTGYDRVLVEHDNTGRVVSFINRVMQGVTTMGVSMYQYTAIYSGEQSIRHLEDGVSQHDMERFFIRELKPMPIQNNPPAEPPKEENPKPSETIPAT